MIARLKLLGIVLAALGLVFVAGGVFAFTQVKAGSNSLSAFSGVQNVNLNYNDEGQLIDRGSPETAQDILRLLKDDWGFAVVDGDLNPDDPVINTATEYMYQMAVITYHVLHGTQTIVLDEDVEYKDEVFEAGTYTLSPAEYFAVEGEETLHGYWTDFDRMHPIEGPARSGAWSGTAHALVAELGVGAVTASTLLLGYGISALIVGIGGTFILAGAGLYWASLAEAPKKKAPAKKAAAKK